MELSYGRAHSPKDTQLELPSLDLLDTLAGFL